MEIQESFICLQPEEADINEVVGWLKKEMSNDIRGCGFYNNRNVIYEAYERGSAITFKYKGKNIGLLIYGFDNELIVDIDIFVIHPTYRGQGYGTTFYNLASQFFRENGYYVIRLFCSPKESETFWQRIGLKKLPECGIWQHDLTYYDVLVDTALKTSSVGMDKIELWDVEPFEAENVEPRWTWYVDSNDDRQSYPIIHPSNCNWKLRWSRNGIVLREDKIKYITENVNEIYISPFLYIKKGF